LTPERLAHIATVLTALIAGIALIIAIFQIRAANHTQREATAQATYNEYLKLALENPELADGRLAPSASEKEKTKYTWFVSFFLHSAEHIHNLFPHEADWVNSLRSQICIHRQYLRSDAYQTKQKTHFKIDFQTFVDTALAGCEG
jgi:hypothetical protein